MYLLLNILEMPHVVWVNVWVFTGSCKPTPILHMWDVPPFLHLLGQHYSTCQFDREKKHTLLFFCFPLSITASVSFSHTCSEASTPHSHSRGIKGLHIHKHYAMCVYVVRHGRSLPLCVMYMNEWPLHKESLLPRKSVTVLSRNRIWLA